MITKSVPTTDAEVELNVLSLLLDVPLTSQDEQDLPTSPISLHSPLSPWSSAVSPALHSASSFDAAPADMQLFRSASPAPIMPPSIQRSKSMDSSHFDHGYSLEMHAAQTAVKAALDVLEEPSLNRGLRISTSLSQSPDGGNSLGLRGCLTAPLSPALSSPGSPAESCFSGTESDGTKKKGRARMSQEKRKRLARRREREALVAALTQQSSDGGVAAAEMHNYVYQNSHLTSAPSASHFSHSAPVTPVGSYFASSTNSTFGGGFPFSSSPTEISSAAAAFNVAISSPRSRTFGFSAAAAADHPSPALTHASVATSSSAFGSIGTPSSSPTSVLSPIGSDASSSPPTLVVQPPSPQRVRGVNFVPRTTAKPSAGNGAYHQQWNGFVSASNLASVY
ncbi:cytoplasmic dynein 1 intermediate chain 2 [Pseudozyma hubeiensis SY62]|uniref:Cytoplasmic dynein 1 intermediate chain 2 n=1 Tax=Pseudozyma hubeiensis (strain SY62) TaxID=1305764 RepID=R9P649_PSEHS|nr:cytoplasmic dynein 1 intermediate chain 2 [Pseudozyma hubeiensis SY62]GAC96868.1 cytoplasmic dynein 1 intermediate chain 2 [Pseudozyma hubeiensis SY62]